LADWYLEDVLGTLHRAEISPLTMNDAMAMRWEPKILWTQELTAKDGRNVHALKDTMTNTIHGGISMSDGEDHVFVHLIESAPHNRTSPRRFINVARLLIAFAGQRSNHIPGGDGFIALTPKDQYRNYYIKLRTIGSMYTTDKGRDHMPRRTITSRKPGNRRELLSVKKRLVDPAGFLTIPSDGLSEASKILMREYRQKSDTVKTSNRHT